MRVLYIFYLAFNLMLSKLAVFDGGTESCRLYLGNSERPQVVSVEVVGADNAQLTNVYGVNFLHTGVVGLFGCPVEVTASEFDGAYIIFSYDRAGLNLVPPQNLLVLWYDEQNSSYRELEARLDEALCTVSLDISQGGALSYEAFVPAEERGADYFPQQAGVEDIALVQQEFDSALDFTMLIPDCLEPYCCKNFTEFDMGGYTEIGLAYCNGSDDIYCDFNLLSGDNVNQSWLDGDNLLHIEGESRTVTDISGKTGIPSEIYVLRFADTGKVESSHLVVYVYGVYHISDTKMVTALYSLWADNADELMPLVTQSLESFRLD